MSAAARVTATAIAMPGPMDVIILKSPTPMAIMPTMTVPADAVMTAPMRLTVILAASCQSPSCDTSSR